MKRCSTGIQCGSNPPNLFKLHLSESKHLVRELCAAVHQKRVFYRYSVWFDPSEPLRTYTNGFQEVLYTGVRCGSNPPNVFKLHLSASKHLVRVFYRCSVWFDPSEPLRTTLMDKQTLGKGVVQTYILLRPTSPPNTSLCTPSYPSYYKHLPYHTFYHVVQPFYLSYHSNIHPTMHILSRPTLVHPSYPILLQP